LQQGAVPYGTDAPGVAARPPMGWNLGEDWTVRQPDVELVVASVAWLP
jgi:hypothetical protein